MELSDLESLENTRIYLYWGKLCCHFFLIAFVLILFILAGNDIIHKSLDEFEIGPDLNTHYRVSYP